jgi:hypothetical protein
MTALSVPTAIASQGTFWASLVIIGVEGKPVFYGLDYSILRVLRN